MCPRDIEVYLSAIFLYLAAALPYHINPPPQDVSSHDTKQILKKKVEELLSEYLTIFLYLYYLYLTNYRSNISEILIKLIFTINGLPGFIVYHVLIYGFNT